MHSFEEEKRYQDKMFLSFLSFFGSVFAVVWVLV
jgi:hypothetical protein